MKLSLQRITNATTFIPAIDGLRFIAIFSVVLFHIVKYITTKDQHYYSNIDFPSIQHVFEKGRIGVPLFFVISGLILGIPFSKSNILNGPPVNLGKFFLRRLTRLEPPYILSLTILFIGSVYFAKTLSFNEGIESYFASIFYIHWLVIPQHLPLINEVTWSLEVEIQFYLLMPILAAIIYRPKLPQARYLVYIAIALCCMISNHFFIQHYRTLFGFIQFFLAGMALADLYIRKQLIFPKTKLDNLIAVAFFVLIWIYDFRRIGSPGELFFWECYLVTCLFFFCYYVLLHGALPILSNKIITNIGGMCYSIYLLHYPIISLFGRTLLIHQFSSNSYLNIIIYAVIFFVLIMTISTLFFLFVERPCMKEDWYKSIFSFNQRKSKSSIA